jgi:DNA modification methylase
MKPVPLLAYPIVNSSMTGCVVLDPFGGSGSTLIACEQAGRVCRMAELDERYCDVIVRRFHQNYPDQPIYRNGERIDPEVTLNPPGDSVPLSSGERSSQ